MPDSPTPYRVLARKYRPQTFAELIGQDAMVTTLGNAIRRDRLAHAFLLTGVRGVGKTSTARLIAKALNCIGPDGQGGPTISPCGQCEPCRAITEGRHIDVVEMDAASHRGIDDIREINDAVRYTAVSARYKIYIVDEVHMLTKEAFNALLKTLEEPPPHVKFLFATTEVNKLPVTVLSRCQRFDLRRIPAETLATHFAGICPKEAVEAEPEALALIARAAEGSVRDGLSILDQAIAHAGAGQAVSAGQVRDMLGLSDRGAIRTLFGLLLEGDAAAALASLKAQYDLGVDPAALFRGLLETVHGVTLAKVGGGVDPALSIEEREAAADWAARLGFATLHRLWQLLLKGLEEVQSTAMPLQAAEMGLLRLIHASQLPDPGELLRRLNGGEPLPALAPGSAPTAAPAPRADYPADMPALVAQLERLGQHRLALLLHDAARVIRFAAPQIALRPVKALPTDLGRMLREATKLPWEVSFDADGAAQPSLKEVEEAAARDATAAILASPVIVAALEAFPEAELPASLRR